MICANCLNDTAFIIKDVNEIIEVRHEKIQIVSKITYCKECGEEVWNSTLDNDNLKRAYEEYRNRHNLLQPWEIREIREKYGLTQIEFAKLLGVGEKTIARYENGAIQDCAQNNLILLMKNINNFKMLYKERKSVFDSNEIGKIESYLFKMSVKVVEGKYTKPINNEMLFGGFNYEERKQQYYFETAVQRL